MAGQVLIYSKTSESETSNSITLYDLFQSMLILFAACSEINKKSEFYKHLVKQNKEQINKNNPIHEFIKKSIKHKEDIAYLFSTTTENPRIDYLYTYYQPKTIFQITRSKHTSKAYSDKNKSKIELNINVLKPLPETVLIELLQSKDIDVISLSATSGIKGDYANCFNKEFMENYSSVFNYDHLTRTKEEAKYLQELRDSREKNRNIEFINFKEGKIFDNFSKNNTSYENLFATLKKEIRSGVDVYDQQAKRLEEVDDFCRIILNASIEGKNTLALSRSNTFMRALKNYDGTLLTPCGDNDNRVFEYKPNNVKYKVRIILFDSQLDLKDEYLTLTDMNTKIVFISSFNSAGTGLNSYITYKSKEEKNGILVDKFVNEDFEDNIIINNPFFSCIKGENGLNSIDNLLVIMKYYSSEKNFKIDQLSTNLVSGKNYKFLILQHCIQILKDVMQIIGRTERCDTKINSRIFIPEELFNSLAQTFYFITKNEDNEIFKNSLSLANTKLLEECERFILNHSFKNDKERELFENKIVNNFSPIDEDFLKTFLMGEYIKDIRNNNHKDTSLNDNLRSINSIHNPKKYINELKNNSHVPSNLSHILDYFYIDKNKYGEIKFSQVQGNHQLLTDCKKGETLYEPENYFSLDRDSALEHPRSKEIQKLIKNISKPNFKEFVPHPAIINLLKGNYGEALTESVFDQIKATPLNDSKAIKIIGGECYELFDWYFIINEELICVDAKSWSAFAENKDLNKELQKKAKEKSKIINNIIMDKDEIKTASFLYVNAKISENENNKLSEVDKDTNIYFLNLFKKYPIDEMKNNKINLKEYVKINNLLEKKLLGDI